MMSLRNALRATTCMFRATHQFQGRTRMEVYHKSIRLLYVSPTLRIPRVELPKSSTTPSTSTTTTSVSRNTNVPPPKQNSGDDGGNNGKDTRKTIDYLNAMVDYPVMIIAILACTFALYFVVTIDNLHKDYQRYRHNLVLIFAKTHTTPLALADSPQAVADDIRPQLITSTTTTTTTTNDPTPKQKQTDQNVVLIRDGLAGFAARPFPNTIDFVTFLYTEFIRNIRLFTRCELALSYLEITDSDPVTDDNPLTKSNQPLDVILKELRNKFNIVSIVVVDPQDTNNTKTSLTGFDSSPVDDNRNGWWTWIKSRIWTKSNSKQQNQVDTLKNDLVDHSFVDDARRKAGQLSNDDIELLKRPVNEIPYEKLKGLLVREFWDRTVILDRNCLTDSKFLPTTLGGINVHEYALNRHLIRLMSFKYGSAENKGTRRAMVREYTRLNKVDEDREKTGLTYDLNENKVVSIDGNPEKSAENAQKRWTDLI